MPDLTALRGALADQAARRALCGRRPGPVLPRLRLLTTAELLCPAPPPACAADAAGELDALCRAAAEMLRRRPGWLAARLDAGPLPVLARPALLQAAVLAWLRCALQAGADGVRLCCRAAGCAAVLELAGGADPRGDAAALLARLAGEGGGSAVFAARGRFAAAVRLPTADGLPLRPAAAPADLLADRYSLPRLYLDGFCAEPEQ